MSQPQTKSALKDKLTTTFLVSQPCTKLCTHESIIQILQMVHPNLLIDQPTSDLIIELCDWILFQVISSVKLTDADQLEQSVCARIGGELAIHANSEMNKAVIRGAQNLTLNTSHTLAYLQFAQSELVSGLTIDSPPIQKLTALIEYLSCELLELSGNQTCDQNQQTITTNMVFQAIGQDPEFCRLFHFKPEISTLRNNQCQYPTCYQPSTIMIAKIRYCHSHQFHYKQIDQNKGMDFLFEILPIINYVCHDFFKGEIGGSLAYENLEKYSRPEYHNDLTIISKYCNLSIPHQLTEEFRSTLLQGAKLLLNSVIFGLNKIDLRYNEKSCNSSGIVVISINSNQITLKQVLKLCAFFNDEYFSIDRDPNNPNCIVFD